MSRCGARSAATPSRSGDASARPGRHIDVVVIYLSVAGIALLPGLLVRLAITSTGIEAVDALLAGLAGNLADIRFGSGLRFWLGFAGAASMGVLLLYPVRKLLPPGGILGSIGAWLKIHMVIGIGGPVLILYHCGFGHGGANANVALWSMLIVTGSGIFGHFVYSRASAEFYSGRQRARAQLDIIAAALDSLGCLHQSRRRIVEDLEAIEAELLTPRQGLASSFRARWRLERSRRQVEQSVAWHIARAVDELQLGRLQHEHLRSLLGGRLAAFFRLARHASSRSIREHLWSAWRHLHLPVFFIMVAAVCLHVRAVWGVDTAAAQKEPQPGRMETSSVVDPGPQPSLARPAPVTGEVSGVVVRAGEATRTFASADAFDEEPADGNAMTVPRGASMPMLLAPPRLAARPADTGRGPPAAGTTQQARRIAQTGARAGNGRPDDIPDSRVTAIGEPIAPPFRLSPPAATEDKQLPVASTPMAGGIDAVYAQLESFSARHPKDVHSLAEQIAEYKAKMKTGQFSHRAEETGFARTGKHAQAECVVCHTQPLRETASNKPRQCLSCHSSDDVHRGRRPDCAKCHGTSRWGEVR